MADKKQHASASGKIVKFAKETKVPTSTRKAEIKKVAQALAYGGIEKSRMPSPMTQKVVVKGKDYMHTINVPSTGHPVGTVLTSFLINPAEWLNTRVGVMSKLYENWEVRHISVTYEPAVATTTPGQICGFFDRDALDSFTSASEENIRRAASTTSFKAGPLWQPVTWEMAKLQDLTVLYTNTKHVDIHWTEAGIFQLLAATALSPSEAEYTIGTVYLNYELVFMTPKLEPGAIGYAYSRWSSAGFTPVQNPVFGTATDWDVNSLAIPAPTDAATLLLEPGHYVVHGWCYGSAGTSGIAATTTATVLLTREVGTTSSVITPFAHYSYAGTDDTGTPRGNTAGFRYDFQCLDGQIRFAPTWVWDELKTHVDHVVYEISMLPPDSSNVLKHLNPGLLGPRLIERHGLGFDFRPADWKVPVQLVKAGVDWLDSKGWTGSLSPLTKGFSKLVGMLLDLGIFNADCSEVPKGLADFWATCGYKRAASLARRPLTAPKLSDPSKDTTLFRENYVMLGRR